jgi:hypothetical protein
VASAGNNVVVTILGGANIEPVNNNINTPTLSAGSVTVLQAPFPKTFTLDLTTSTGKTLTLNKGYKLQDINITSNLPATGGTAVTIAHPTAGLASVDVTCAGVAANAVTCVEVQGAGSHILKDVRVDVTDLNAGNFGIKNNDTSINLTIVGGRVRPIGDNNPIKLIDSQGVLTVKGLTVDMTGGGAPNPLHARASTGILLRAPGSSVTGSTITVNDGPNASNKAIGIDVQGTASKSTVKDNVFIAVGNNTVGVNGNGNLFFTADIPNNNFLGNFGAKVQ